MKKNLHYATAVLTSSSTQADSSSRSLPQIPPLRSWVSKAKSLLCRCKQQLVKDSTTELAVSWRIELQIAIPVWLRLRERKGSRLRSLSVLCPQQARLFSRWIEMRPTTHQVRRRSLKSPSLKLATLTESSSALQVWILNEQFWVQAAAIRSCD